MSYSIAKSTGSKRQRLKVLNGEWGKRIESIDSRQQRELNCEALREGKGERGRKHMVRVRVHSVYCVYWGSHTRFRNRHLYPLSAEYQLSISLSVAPFSIRHPCVHLSRGFQRANEGFKSGRCLNFGSDSSLNDTLLFGSREKTRVGVIQTSQVLACL